MSAPVRASGHDSDFFSPKRRGSKAGPRQRKNTASGVVGPFGHFPGDTAPREPWRVNQGHPERVEHPSQLAPGYSSSVRQSSIINPGGRAQPSDPAVPPTHNPSAANPRQGSSSAAGQDTHPAHSPAVREKRVKPQPRKPIAIESSSGSDDEHTGVHPEEHASEPSDERVVEGTPKRTIGKRLSSPSAPRDTGRSRLKQKLARLEPNAHSVGGVSERWLREHAGEQPTEYRARSFSPQGRPPKTGAKEKVLCVNNRNDPRLHQSGFRLGSPGECVAKGFGSALHQKIAPGKTEAFIRQFSVPYEKLINLDDILWFKNGPPPLGKHRATLPMCFQKGYGAGSAALAKKLKEQQHGASR